MFYFGPPTWLLERDVVFVCCRLLIVHSHADSSPHKLDTTSTAFFQSLATALKATSAGNVVLDVNPSHVHPVTVEGTVSKIFVRPCYQKLWDAIRATTLVRSHIGKAAFCCCENNSKRECSRAASELTGPT